MHGDASLSPERLRHNVRSQPFLLTELKAPRLCFCFFFFPLCVKAVFKSFLLKNEALPNVECSGSPLKRPGLQELAWSRIPVPKHLSRPALWLHTLAIPLKGWTEGL